MSILGNVTSTNMFSCSGLGTDILGGCSQAWIALAVIVFLIMVIRRQCDDGVLAGTSFNFFGAFIGVITFLLLITLFGNIKLAFIAGIIGIFGGGFVVGLFTNSSGPGGGDSGGEGSSGGDGV